MADADVFESLRNELSAQGPQAALDHLAAELRRERRFHDLFDVRLLQARLKLGLPAVFQQPLDDLPEPQRGQMEDASLAACREVGTALLDAGQLREAWMYLRPLGERAEMARALERLAGESSLTDQIVDIALHEGVSPRLGFQLVLDNYGVCNAVTMYDSDMHTRPRKDRQEVASLLVRRMHDDLLANLRADITRQQGSAPKESTIAALVADRDWLFANDNYHVDTSHLSAIVRFALILEDRADVERAYDLCEYGRRLSPTYHYPGEDPFAETYVSHARFFGAQLGREVDEALAYFREIAAREIEEGSGYPAEVYVALLVRLGRPREALEVAAEWFRPGVRLTGFAPNLLELARQAGAFDRLVEVARARGDLLTYATGLVAGGTAAAPAK